jgi:hypothetical protein
MHGDLRTIEDRHLPGVKRRMRREIGCIYTVIVLVELVMMMGCWLDGMMTEIVVNIMAVIAHAFISDINGSGT